MNFSQLIDSIAHDVTHDVARSHVLVPDDWMQGRTIYGGLTAAIALEAARARLAVSPEDAPLRSAMITFIGPAGGEIGGRAEILRQGRSASFVGADLFCEDRLVLRALFVFGAARPSAFDLDFLPAPDLPGPDACAAFFPPDAARTFTAHYETRLARGGQPISGSAEHDHFLWVRHKDEGAAGEAAFIAMADMPPPAILPMFKTFAPISSITWQVNMLAEAPASEDGWWLLESRAENARAGYSSQDMFIWNRAGQPMAASRQSVAIFA